MRHGGIVLIPPCVGSKVLAFDDQIELGINLKTAMARGLTIPPTIRRKFAMTLLWSSIGVLVGADRRSDW